MLTHELVEALILNIFTTLAEIIFLDFETAKFLVVDSGGESFGFARRILVITVGQMDSGRLVMNVGSGGGDSRRLAHQGCQTEIPLDNFSFDKFLQRKKVLVLKEKRWSINYQLQQMAEIRTLVSSNFRQPHVSENRTYGWYFRLVQISDRFRIFF